MFPPKRWGSRFFRIFSILIILLSFYLIAKIIYFYNNNKTLPLGMDVSTRVLMKPQEFSEEKITEFNIILEDGPFNVEIREIELIEDASKE